MRYLENVFFCGNAYIREQRRSVLVQSSLNNDGIPVLVGRKADRREIWQVLSGLLQQRAQRQTGF